jgi:Zn finger protein HypA/HybF involved in hydrogenase expression
VIEHSAARVVVVGEGALASEVVRNLALAGIPSALHRPADFWSTLRLADLQDCYCAVAAGCDRQSLRRLNALVQVAGVDFVSVSLGPDGIVLATFPYGSDTECACAECDLDTGPADLVAAQPDPIATGIAGGLAAAAALQCAGSGARRLSIPAPVAASTSTPLHRRSDCPACATPLRSPRVVRTRNRWAARTVICPDTAALDGQTLRLSDSIVIRCECPHCGPVAVLAGAINRPVHELPDDVPACPVCGATALRIEARDEFSLRELTERFGSGPVPAKFALANIGGTAVCFDLESAPARDAGPA